ncbi:polysaccharide deacetylase family protein [Paenibacillus aurantiacus]|uniref:Polysaccharide deacetylase family protein n=1 Tax=Paenibacillus aurantiacus TaxID=1936118 RepID=A0ABV5KS52_9BACL
MMLFLLRKHLIKAVFCLVLGYALSLWGINSVSAESPVVGSDNFTDGDANGWTIIAGGGKWSVADDGSGTNNAYYSISDPHYLASAFGDSNWNSYTVETNIKLKSGVWNNAASIVGVVGRLSDVKNYYKFSYDNSTKAVSIIKWQGGAPTTLATANYTYPSLNTYHTFKLEMSGTTLRGYIDGVLLLTATDSTFTKGRAGVFSYYQATYYDDVKVTGTRILLNTYPNGLHKALTFSYDDGRTEDRQLLPLFSQYNMKGTFHLNSGLLGTTSAFITSAEVAPLYAGQEVASHTVDHTNLATLTDSASISAKIQNDRTALQALTGYPIYGFAYPNGGYNSRVLSVVRSSGLRYARTVNSTYSFDLPSDFMLWSFTVRQIDKNLNTYGQNFLNLGDNGKMNLFSVWGHSFELSSPATYYISWDRLTSFFSMMSNKSDIWYATNLQIYDYVNAVRALTYTGTTIYNPSSSIKVWVTIDGAVRQIGPLQTITY